MQFIKPKYPEKRTINFAKQIKTTPKYSLILGGGAIGVILLVIFVKFGFVDQFQSVGKAQETYQRLQAQIDEMKEITKNYSEVTDLYRRMGNDFLTEEEAAEWNRLDVLKIAEDSVKDRGEIESISITSNQLMITLDKTSLDLVSAIVADLEKQEETAYVTVSTAGTGQNNNQVPADIFVYLKSGGEQQ